MNAYTKLIAHIRKRAAALAERDGRRNVRKFWDAFYNHLPELQSDKGDK